jgi:hypothetical protein
VESAFCFVKHNPLIFADMQATTLFLKSKPGKIVQQNMGELMRHEVLAPRFFFRCWFNVWTALVEPTPKSLSWMAPMAWHDGFQRAMPHYWQWYEVTWKAE